MSESSHDDFLSAIAHQRAEDDVASVATSAFGRLGAAIGLVVALVVGALALNDGATRASGNDLFSSLSNEPDAFDLPITAPFPGTTVRLVANQRAALVSSEDGAASVRLASPDVGAIIGLEREGETVALGILPPGLDTPPEQLLVSPVSTALTLAALHPDLLTSDPQSYLARIAMVAQAAAFPEVIGLIDGETPITELRESLRRPVQNLVDEALAAVDDVAPTCNATPLTSGGVVRCVESGEVQGLRNRWALVVDTFDEPCGAIPPITFELSDAAEASLTELLASGSPVDPAAVATVTPKVGVLNAPLICGEGYRVVTNPVEEVDLARTIVASATYRDDAVGLARMAGGQPLDHDELVVPDLATQATLEQRIVVQTGALAPAGRMRLSQQWVSGDRTSEIFGLDQIESDANVALVDLTELLVDVYR